MIRKGDALDMKPQSMHPDFSAVVQPNSEVRRVATGMAFTEGPVWIETEQCVFFTDIPNNAIMRWSEHDGLSIYNANSHFAIGLYLDLEGRLIVCEHTTRRLTRYEHDGRITVLASGYRGHVLNSTNDVVVRASDGRIFFTDPPFGVRQEDGQLYGYQQAMEYGACGVFCVTEDPNAPQLVTDAIYRPNGLCFSPDERTLYISDSSERYHRVYALRMQPDDTAVDPQVFFVMPAGVPDGMRVDTEGRLYIAGLDGVYVCAPDGVLLGKLPCPEMVTNCCFGGPGRHTLFMTAVSSLYAVDLASTGLQKP
jgi:gluconolactonase